MNDNIIISNQDVLDAKIEKIKEDGISRFHVVSDFDRTLTKLYVRGKKQSSGMAQIREGGYLTPDYAPKAFALHDKYRPLETDESIPLEQRSKYMLQWWSEHIDLISKSKMSKGIIDDIIRKRLIGIREGTLEFYDLLSKNNIPLLIFSAGVGDLIEGVLKQEDKMYKNIHIISNFFDFDEDGFVKGYKSDIIHTFNKNESNVRNSPYYKDLKGKKNVILVGDTIADTGMIEGMGHETTIKIGFLNEDVDKLRDAYAKVFDAVILNDGPFDYVNDLLKQILD